MASGRLARTFNRWGDRGTILLPDVVHARVTPFVVGFGLLLIAGLWLLDHFTAR
jgi:hypothetical protein